MEENDAKRGIGPYTPAPAAGESAETHAARGGFDGTFLELLGLRLLCFLVTVVTFGLAGPAAQTWIMRWTAEHTFYEGRRLSFDGSGISLFGHTILWSMLCLITFGIYLWFLPKRSLTWRIRHTHFADSGDSAVSDWRGSAIMLVCVRFVSLFITFISLGILYPVALAVMTEYEYSQTFIDGERMELSGKASALIPKWMLWTLFSVVTLGVYSICVTVKFNRWFAEHTRILVAPPEG